MLSNVVGASQDKLFYLSSVLSYPSSSQCRMQSYLLSLYPKNLICHDLSWCLAASEHNRFADGHETAPRADGACLFDAVGADSVAGEAALPGAPGEAGDAVAVEVVAALVEARVALIEVGGVHAHGPTPVVRPAASDTKAHL